MSRYVWEKYFITSQYLPTYKQNEHLKLINMFLIEWQKLRRTIYVIYRAK